MLGLELIHVSKRAPVKTVNKSGFPSHGHGKSYYNAIPL